MDGQYAVLNSEIVKCHQSKIPTPSWNYRKERISCLLSEACISFFVSGLCHHIALPVSLFIYFHFHRSESAGLAAVKWIHWELPVRHYMFLSLSEEGAVHMINVTRCDFGQRRVSSTRSIKMISAGCSNIRNNKQPGMTNVVKTPTATVERLSVCL